MNKNRMLKLMASVIMFCAGVMMIVFNFTEKKEYMLIASICMALFGLVLVFTNLFNKKEKK
ncbi:MAG: hypothetical protein IJE89_06630 [Bacilli bacterium]|nr:hypothetical protein [Bacilli bacterium]